MNLSEVSQTSLADWQYRVSALTTECRSEHQRWCQPRWGTCDRVLQPVISINTPILKWAQRLTEASSIYHTYIHAYIHPFNGLFSGIKKVKPIWILLKQETVSGTGMSWAIFYLFICCWKVHMKQTKQMTLQLDRKVHDSNTCPTLKHKNTLKNKKKHKHTKTWVICNW